MNKNYVERDVFNTLNNFNVNGHTEKKNNLTYLSWAWAWAELKKRFPDSTYIIYENNQGWNYFTDGRTCWTKVGVIIEGLEHIEYLPIMDYYNKSIPLDKVTSKDVNTSIQRGLTKAIARHGLGLYIYAGEDLPEASGNADTPKAESKPIPAPNPAPSNEVIPAPAPSVRAEASENNTMNRTRKWTTIKTF